MVRRKSRQAVSCSNPAGRVQAAASAKIARATLYGGGPVEVRQDADAATFTLPPTAGEQFVPVVRIEGAGLI